MIPYQSKWKNGLLACLHFLLSDVYLNSDFVIYQETNAAGTMEGSTHQASFSHHPLNKYIQDIRPPIIEGEATVSMRKDESPVPVRTIGLKECELKMRKSSKKFKCQFCDKAWDNNYKLQRHILTHTGEKPYQCDICSRRFTQKSHMESHKVTHSGILKVNP